MIEHIDDKLSRLERYHRIIDDIATALGYRTGDTYEPEALVEKVKKLVKVPKQNFKLCYIDKNDTAYFTTQEIDKQWGDDWDDAPYEHNAGTPYEPHYHHYSDGRKEKIAEDWNEDGTPKWEIYKLKYDCWRLTTPAGNYGNSPYSVRDINAGAVAWMFGLDQDGTPVTIPAGTSIEVFKQKIKQAGGQIYVVEE